MSKLYSRYIYDEDDLPEQIKPGPGYSNIAMKKFGRLTALYPSSRNADRRIEWLCLCECGNFVEVSGKHLRSGNTKSCGCLHIDRIKETNQERVGAGPKNMIGERYGKLVVVSSAGYEKTSDGKNRALYNCKCDCGNECVIRSVYLRTGDTKSCGCLRSLGELQISNLLKDNSLKFNREFQVKIEGLNPGFFRFDFQVITDKQSYFIEFDGEQHYNGLLFRRWNSIEESEKKFKELRERDEAKNKFCLQNNIPLIRIPYTKLDEIDIRDLQLETTTYLIEEVEFNEEI